MASGKAKEGAKRQPKDVLVGFRVLPEQREYLHQIATYRKQSISDMCRDLLWAQLRQLYGEGATLDDALTVERLRLELTDARESLLMSCIEPDPQCQCSGCRYARERLT